MALISNLFKNKIYLFGQKKHVLSIENVIIEEIFNTHNLAQIKNINFIDANVDNDLFLVDTVNYSVFVKLSFNKEKLEKEFKLLEKNIELRSSTYPLAYGYLDQFNLSYEVLGKFPLPNLFDYGVSTLHQQLQVVTYFASNLHSFLNVEELTSINDYFNFYLNFNISTVPNFNVDWVENHQDIKYIVNNQIIELQKILKDRFATTPLKEEVVCHGDLRASNILVAEDGLKAINFENSYLGDRAFDFACMKYVFYYSIKQDLNLWKQYCELNNIEFSVAEYRKYQDLAAYFNLLKIMINYLIETYVLKGSKQNRILQCAVDLSKNFNAFANLPEFNTKLKPIAEFFVESVI